MVERKRVRELTRKLSGNPFFPLLFIGESAKTGAFYLVGEATASAVSVSAVMALASVILWLYSYEDVAWGLYEKAEEKIE